MVKLNEKVGEACAQERRVSQGRWAQGRFLRGRERHMMGVQIKLGDPFPLWRMLEVDTRPVRLAAAGYRNETTYLTGVKENKKEGHEARDREGLWEEWKVNRKRGREEKF